MSLAQWEVEPLQWDGVNWSIGTRLDAELVNSMLDAAIETVDGRRDRPFVPCDRGSRLFLRSSSTQGRQAEQVHGA